MSRIIKWASSSPDRFYKLAGAILVLLVASGILFWFCGYDADLYPWCPKCLVIR